MWQIFIDTGGTFTDCIAIDNEGKTKRAKVLSSGKLRASIEKVEGNKLYIKQNWNCDRDIFKSYSFKILSQNFEALVKAFDPEKSVIRLDSEVDKDVVGCECEIYANEEAPVLACRLLTKTSIDEAMPDLDLRLGSTKGTNALLERKGNPPVLLVTKGFADMLLIGTQQRTDLFALNICKPKLYYSQVIEIDERIGSDGEVLNSLAIAEVEKLADRLIAQGVNNIAVSLLNAYRNPVHEQQIESILQVKGIQFISASNKIESSINYLTRTQTTVVNAYLHPVLDAYINNIKAKLSRGSLFKVMTSAGGLAQVEKFFPKDSLLSGPAGGVVGTAALANQTGRNKVLAFDMGGTSTDVSRFCERYDYQYVTTIGDASIMSPAIYIETIAAGGGSICSYDGTKFTVGPHSAGASPGPASYGNGGPLTITDVNLLLGRVPSAKFRIPLNKKDAQLALADFKKTHQLEHIQDEEVLEGFLRIANEMMAEAIRKISISKGYKTADYSLMAFGGAGAMHACAIADILNVNEVVIPYDAGILSAVGIGTAVCEHFESRQVLKLLTDIEADLPQLIAETESAAMKALESSGIAPHLSSIRQRILRIRCKGQDFCIEVDYNENVDIQQTYKKKYIELFGYWNGSQLLEVESVKVIAEEKSKSSFSFDTEQASAGVADAQIATQKLFVQDKWTEVPVYDSDKLNTASSLSSPSIVANNNCTIYIADGWNVEVDENKNLLLNKAVTDNSKKKTRVEEVELELFTRRFESIVNDMGALLQRSAFSVNIKERMDFSCALLDAQGMLVANAPHIPVHLGALGICCRSIMSEIEIHEGDIIITNHPAYGGSHLPDVTLIAPVYFNSDLIGFVANRAHHAELGGICPGSMPADAVNLEEEGVVIYPYKIVEKGESRIEGFKKILNSAKYPSRSPQDNLADISAAVASIKAGSQALTFLCRQENSLAVKGFMQKLSQFSLNQLQQKLQAKVQEPLCATELLDDGSPIQVQLSMDNNKLAIDFSGSAPQRTDNLNATPAIVNSAVLYVLRLCIDQNVPMNEGVLQMVDIINPKGMLNPDFNNSAEFCPPVVGGNVETSQRIVDCLLKALRMSACSQGTMNNLIFGNDQFGYYETICGGTGAGDSFHGADAVHQHMTNTKITDPEVLEQRFPVRLLEFGIRHNSGGEGKWKGGNGCKRKLQFLVPVQLTLLSQHRVSAPYGMEGGGDAKTGKQYIIESTGAEKEMKGADTVCLQKGDIFCIETPGGGAWGNKTE